MVCENARWCYVWSARIYAVNAGCINESDVTFESNFPSDIRGRSDEDSPLGIILLKKILSYGVSQ